MDRVTADATDDVTADVVLLIRDWDDVDGVALRDAQQREIRARYGGDTEPGVKPSAVDISVFLIAYDQVTSTALGCGALRDLGDNTVEVKRMYVHPDHRGRGIGRRVLAALESHALEQGATRIRLETGRLQPDAVRLYEAAGYRQIPKFGAYVESAKSLCFERVFAVGS
jgi:GNAT superfamily N-acetyltransferase